MTNRSTFSPDSTRLQQLVAELRRPAFHSFLSPVAESVGEDGAVTVRLPYKPEFSGSDSEDFFHGGIIASLVDLSAYAAIAMHTGQPAPTIDLRVDYLRPARPPYLIAEAAILKLGRTVSRADVRVLDHKGGLVAVGRGAFASLVQDRSG